MRLSNVIAVGALGVGAPLLLAGAGLYSRAECRIDQNAKTVTPIGYKSELQWLFIVAGIGQGALAWRLFQDLREDDAEDETETPQTLPETTLPVFNPPPVMVKAELEPIAPHPAPTYVYQPQQLQSHPVVTAPKPQQAAQPQQPSLIKSLAASHLSIVFSAPPGTGKTTTELAWMAHVFHQSPNATMFVACWKNDSFLGLSSIPGAVELLDGVDWIPLLRQVNRVFNILKYRRGLPKERRSEFEGKPVWLVLADYFATFNTLSQDSRHKQLWLEIRSQLGTIITVGREFGVGAAIDTHSFNIAALGVSDANIRDCLTICALGKITRDGDREDGGYGAIAKAIGNKFVVDDDTIRSQLLTQELPQLQKRSDETGRPVLFTTLGYPPRLALLPDFRQFETFLLPPHALERIVKNMQAQMQRAEPVATSEQQDLRQRLEGLLPQLPEQPNPWEVKPAEGSEDLIDRPTNETSHFPQSDKFLYQAVKAHLDSGKSVTWVVEEVLGFKGRKFSEGQQFLKDLIARFEGEE